MKRPIRPTSARVGHGHPSADPAEIPSEDADEQGIDLFHDDMPERDVHADLLTDDGTVSFREEDRPAPLDGPSGAALLPAAEDEPGEAGDAALPPTRHDAGPTVDAPLDHGSGSAAPDAPRGGDEPAEAPPARRAQQRSARPGTAGPVPAPPAGEDPPAASGISPALSPDPRPGRGRRGRPSRLPPGERWKERRLPRVCWDR